MFKKYNLLSPDGFTISPDYFISRSDTIDYYNKWLKRYEKQGYYSTTNRQRIPLNELFDHCEFIEIE